VIDEEGSRKKRLRIRIRLRKKHEILLNFIGSPFIPPSPPDYRKQTSLSASRERRRLKG
jgi:hypothetical protein